MKSIPGIVGLLVLPFLTSAAPPAEERASSEALVSLEYEWMELAQLESGEWIVVAAKPKQIGSGDSSCALRSIEAADGTVLEVHCSGKPVCIASHKDCELQSREYQAFVLVWCECR